METLVHTCLFSSQTRRVRKTQFSNVERNLRRPVFYVYGTEYHRLEHLGANNWINIKACYR